MRTLLIEDDDAYRLGVETFLARLSFVSGIESACDGEEGLQRLERSRFDAVVLDIGLPGLGGLETCRRIVERHELPVLILTSQEDDGWVQRLWEAGASGYLHKSAALDQLEMALRSLAEGASWWDRSATRALRQGSEAATGSRGGSSALPLPGELAGLTPREREVLEAMAEGLTNREVGERLGIGAGTVRMHLGAIFQKLEVSNRTQAVLRFLGRR